MLLYFINYPLDVIYYISGVGMIEILYNDVLLNISSQLHDLWHEIGHGGSTYIMEVS